MFRRRRRRTYKTPVVFPKSPFLKPRKKISTLTPLGKSVIVISLLCFFVIIGIGVGVIVAFTSHLPNLDPVLKYEGMETWKFPTKLYSVENKLIADFAEEKRELVNLDQIPQLLKDAVIVIEDKQFYKHKGIDLTGLIRAFLVNIRSGKILQGGSTITQQLAKNLFLTQERSYRRKIQEVLIALLIERKLTKEEILERYFNKIYYGHGNYGAQAASLYYFDKPVNDLSVAEIAMLAGLPNSPVHYSPIAYPQKAIERQAIVLNQMEKEGLITPDQEIAAKNDFEKEVKRISKKKFAKAKTTINKAPYFTEYIRQILEQEYGSNALYTGGLNVYTTLNLQMQEAAQEALVNGLEQLNAAKKAGEPRIEGALLAIDPRTGNILAMVGGSGFIQTNQLNRAIYAKRQPGSAFKPIIYTAAIDQGFTPINILDDSPKTYIGADGTEWSPSNYNDDFYGRVTLRTALELSLNLATIKLLEEVGVRRVIEYAHKMGIKNKLPADLSLALGTAQVTPLEMTKAFGVFANQGIKVELLAIQSIKDHQQNLLEERTTKEERVISAQTAYLITSMLEGVVQRGTAKYSVGNKIDRVVAGKTGTTNDYVDAWFIGYTPELVATVWIGYDRGQRSLGHGRAGGVVAAPIWTAFVQKILPLLESTDFTVPAGVNFAIVDPSTGMLATKYCPKTRYEVFVEGNCPTQYCTYHGKEEEGTIEELGVGEYESQSSSTTTPIEEKKPQTSLMEDFDKIRLEE
ncbi:MAG: PBP1A family penicillin-binding protein [bacterium]|nr:PBP1A family penicillin-binding protein [bacterium]